MRPVPTLLIQRASACALAISLLLQVGCAARGNVSNSMEQRAKTQQELAQQDSLPVQADSRATYLQLVTQMQQKGLYFASLAHIDALQQRWGVDADSNLLLADAMRQTGQPDKAQALYSQLMTTPVKARAAHGLGLLAGRAGDFQGAVVHMQQATQMAPTDADMLNDLGFVLMQLGQWKEARVPLMKASELASDNPRIWSNVALFLTLDGQPMQANEVMAGRKLTVVSRTQIAELARSIRQRAQPSAAIPVNTPQAPIGTAVAMSVLSPTLRMDSLSLLHGRNPVNGSSAATSAHATAN